MMFEVYINIFHDFVDFEKEGEILKSTVKIY